jgi:RNA recognition motif-containing protein
MATTATAVKKILIGNLPETAHSTAIEDLFKQFGDVLSVAVLNHGFAFVEMTADDAEKALQELKGYRWSGKPMMIDEAHPGKNSKY